MEKRVKKYDLQIDKVLYDFITYEVLEEIKLDKEQFWQNVSNIFNEMTPKNLALLNKRTELQKKINAWNLDNKGKNTSLKAYKTYLEEIGYLIPEGEAFEISTNKVDDEISTICGPQLVVPITNARYALNAANARWGSLYDALYGTDAMGTKPSGRGYDKERGEQVIKFAKNYLDNTFPLNGCLWEDIDNISI